MPDYARRAIEWLGDADTAMLEGDEQKLFAIVRAVEIVGEASGQVSPDMVKQNPGLPWQAAKAMRNMLIHAYPEVRADVVASTVREDFPKLIGELERILAETPE
jgi:uncharacterized protein with HEPN domain